MDKRLLKILKFSSPNLNNGIKYYYTLMFKHIYIAYYNSYNQHLIQISTLVLFKKLTDFHMYNKNLFLFL